MSISLVFRAVSTDEWKRVCKSTEDEINSWLFVKRKPTHTHLPPEEIAKLTREERRTLVNQMFECCDIYSDRAVIDFRWCKMVNVIVELKSGIEPDSDGSELRHLLAGSFATPIQSVYGNVRVFPKADIEATLARIEALDWHSSLLDARDVLVHPELSFLDLRSLPDDIEDEVWYTIERLYKLFKRHNSGDHVILEYSE